MTDRLPQEIPTLVDRHSSFDGKITFEGTARIDGAFAGEIRTDGTLVLGPTAKLRGDVVAHTIIVEGEVHGDLTATAVIDLRASARVHGNLAAPSLEVAMGSVFEGQCQMPMDGAPVSELRPRPKHPSVQVSLQAHA